MYDTYMISYWRPFTTPQYEIENMRLLLILVLFRFKKNQQSRQKIEKQIVHGREKYCSKEKII